MDKKVVQILYPLFFWLFVGFRDNIGTDYPSTLESVERSVMPFADITTNFLGYNALDLEATHKIIAMLMYSLGSPLRVYYVLLAGVEAIIIGYIIRKSNNYKIYLFFFICLFSINYPMNAVRQGFCFMLTLLALFVSIKQIGRFHGKFASLFYYILAMASHYGSIPVVLLTSLKFKKWWTYVVVFFLLISFLLFVDLDLLGSRYKDVDTIYRFSGGLRFFLFTYVLCLTYKNVLKRSLANQDILVLLSLMIGVFIKNSLLRIFFMFANVLIFKILMEADDKIISPNKKIRLCVFPAMSLAFELLEIIRTVPISGTGIWFPYTNWIF